MAAASDSLQGFKTLIASLAESHVAAAFVYQGGDPMLVRQWLIEQFQRHPGGNQEAAALLIFSIATCMYGTASAKSLRQDKRQSLKMQRSS